MVKSNLFINYLFLIIFLLNNCFSQEKIVKSVSISGAPSNDNKIVFFNNEIMNVNFDELSAKPYNFYYSVEHYDYNWELSNIFKNEYITGFDDIRISNYKNSFNTLQKFISYSFNIPNKNFKINSSGNYKLIVKDNRNNIVFERKFVFINNYNLGNIEISRAKEINLINEFHNLKISFSCTNCIYDVNSQYKLVVLKNKNFNDLKIFEKPTLKTSNKLIFDNILFNAGDEYHGFDTKNILSTSNEIKRVENGPLYSTVLYDDVQKNKYSYNPDKNGIFKINNNGINENTESDYTKVKFSFLSSEDIIGDLYVVGGFNNYELSEEFKLLETSKNTYVTELLLKQGFYNYKYVVKNNNLISDISNFWQTENEYTAFLYEKKPSDRFYKIIGYANKNSLKIVN